MSNGIVFVISGPSGSGKGTVVEILRKKYPNVGVSVSATSRAPREGEIEGVNYHYKTREQFEELIRNGEVLEYTEYNGNYYGTLKSEAERIISAGRFGKEKGFDMLVKAFAPVVRKHPDWHLDIYGDGEMFDTVKELIENLKIADNVHLMGMCSNLSDKYKDYSMYVLPSYREGLPLVLLEAKANRLPIVSFDILTGPREIMRDGVDGILVPPYDLEKMGAAICRLIEDDSLRISMSEKSQDNVENFSKPTILKQWCDLIESI